MKKVLLAAVLTVSAGLAMAQTNATPAKDGVMMKDGKVMMMKDGKTMPLDKEITLSDGSKHMMKNGDSMDMSGMSNKK